jgi:cytidylate kinase
MRITITIARQLGCGGSALGQHLAQNLGIRCIDREIISQTAQRFHIDERELAGREEKVSSFWERMFSGLTVGVPEAAFLPAPIPTLSDQEIFESETAVLKAIAQEEDCVIVGRAAAHVIPTHEGLINLYLHAPLSFRVPRVMEAYHLQDETQARTIIARSDGLREKFIAQMTRNNATDARNYHLSLDSSVLPLTETADFISDYVQRRVGISKSSVVIRD